ncbi:MAG: hypothetical protein JWQ09_131, partial [Segetibacter sp.]|nr:hypothetical protein [Segetibacter sp.]
MNFAAQIFPGFTRKFLKIAYSVACIIGLFYASVAYAGSPFSNDRFENGEAISCTITNKLITIKNANTTFRIDNAFHLEVLFFNSGQSYSLMKNGAAGSVLSIHSNNQSIFFTRKTTRTSETNNNKYGKGKIITVEGLSSDSNLICNLSFEAYYNFPDVILVQSAIKNISGKTYPIQDYTLS